MKAMGILAFGAVGLALSLSSCKSATGESDLPLEEWVITSAYVAWADSTKTAYSTHVSIVYADSTVSTEHYTDDYAGNVGTDPLTLYTISPGTISSGTLGTFILSTIPDPATHPIITFDTNHYFYRRGSGYSSTVALAKCHIKTSSIAVTFEQ